MDRTFYGICSRLIEFVGSALRTIRYFLKKSPRYQCKKVQRFVPRLTKSFLDDPTIPRTSFLSSIVSEYGSQNSRIFMNLCSTVYWVSELILCLNQLPNEYHIEILLGSVKSKALIQIELGEV